jgi:phosphatidate cytidylyltransferase
MIAVSALTLALRPIAQTPIRPVHHSRAFVCFFLGLPFQYMLVAANWCGLFATFILVYVFLARPIHAVRFRDAQRFLDRSN